MKLTGQAKSDFEKWYMALRQSEMDRDEAENTFENANLFFVHISTFYNTPLSFQFGVYVDWADSVGIYISIDLGKNQEDNYVFPIWINEEYYYTSNSRHEARELAIKKLDELYNKQI